MRLPEHQNGPDRLGLRAVQAADALIKYEPYPQHIRSALAQWYQSLIAKAQIDVLALVQSENFGAVDRALLKYTKIGSAELKQDLSNLTRHRDNMVARTRKRLQTLAVTAEDPVEITHALDEDDEYTQYIAEETKTLRERWSKLVQLAQDDMLRMVQVSRHSLQLQSLWVLPACSCRLTRVPVGLCRALTAPSATWSRRSSSTASTRSTHTRCTGP